VGAGRICLIRSWNAPLQIRESFGISSILTIKLDPSGQKQLDEGIGDTLVSVERGTVHVGIQPPCKLD
jgi:hypothetical protein